ncbi:hypothetical protein A2715_02010 [Candidatus Woesebacteria bacterium RIFCSPHIGHO2_01_FULL_39_32]|uniref:Quinoprotein glucose dehydrogenase n=2 Tax=Candidatus Woeseibacteriota TaxID=1752722 RepID=A0A0G0PRJ8_9BACT|nr:MAG: Quinoprotein glucose dehydrogenase [Candidatus Woesebacteria bacterium GW2011_GWA1_39_8]OGM03437.1 MAG: hypothetical protein A2124_02245 [Candidatus Woesebacteria bacterium GWB1_37_5]OGM23932.1 MAG: hypothetical protein A2715_02010 [Candidatus Woesebacteria bacterium RIFCSPHIGHO2_01_FULL_39_32]OGM37438.1 MAG: hypothetical protein A3F01_03245 [Candidatus Woesebacteria bacterium RIFCSPHIGHO2_12_FULL_38_11]OGM64121.1 MAG: hypothetical protein A2893_03250 [Candidatus Woesebacteria bacterium
MNKVTLIILALILVAVGVFYARTSNKSSGQDQENKTSIPFLNNNSQDSSDNVNTENIPKTTVIATGLDTPWAIAFLPDGGVLITERKGTVRLINSSGDLLPNPIAEIECVKEIGEGGLQGIALHPDFPSNYFVYLYYTYSESGGNTLNKVVRMTYRNQKLSDEKVIVNAIPGAANHDGGRIKFGPDKMLYITTGDAQNPSNAQDTDSLSGKILRVTYEGNPAAGNPFRNRVYSYGHRNPQGISWDANGTLWETEHGPSGLETGNDEFNRIEIGKNYGWPEIRGKETREGMVTPIIESGRSDTWAPAGLAYINGKFYFGGLRGQALYRVTLSGNSAELETFFKGEFGRLREVIAGPDNMLYITTSNRDGRGDPESDDDKVIRVNPEKL